MIISEDTIKIAEEIKNTLLQIADKSKLKKTKLPRKKDSLPWFDKECLQSKQNIQRLGNTLKKSPGDYELRAELFNQKKSLKNLIRKKKRLYEQTIINKMTYSKETKNQKSFWKLLNKLRKRSHDNINVSPEALTKHIRTTLTSKRNISIPPNNYDVGKLDYHFTSEELKKASSILKRGKATGIDNLNNEMLVFLVENYPLLVIKLFNIILDSNKAIPDWTIGMITPIFKTGSKCDPANYRGISLLSCFGKNVMTLLNNRLTGFCIKKQYYLTKPTGVHCRKPNSRRSPYRTQPNPKHLS